MGRRVDINPKVSNHTEQGLLVLHEFPRQPPWERLQGTRWKVLSFLSEEEEALFASAAGERSVVVAKIVRAADNVEASALATRAKFSEFMQSWPDRFRQRGRTFKEMFTYRGELSYWWLTNASLKQNEFSLIFERLCQLEIVKGELKPEMTCCAFIGQDSMTALLIGRTCRDRGLSFFGGVSGQVGAKSWGLYGFLARLWLVCKLVAMLALFRAFFRTPDASAGRAIGFYTLFPALASLANGGLSDRNYRDLPAYISQQTKLETVLLASFSPASWRDWLDVWKQRRLLQAGGAPRILFLESYLRFSDLLMALANLGFLLRYLRLERSSAAFRQSFQYDGINIFELVAPEFSRAFLGNQLPSYLVLVRLVERALREYPVSHLVCFLELYPAARAVYYGAGKSDSDVVTVAYQHANISSMKLWYTYRPEEVVPGIAAKNGRSASYVQSMPSPDRYLFQGENGLRVILESGYPRERCRVTGSPRYDGLGNLISAGSLKRPGRSPSGPGQARRVLVVPSYSDVDAQELVEASVKACSGLPFQSRVLVKPHPSSAIAEKIPGIGQSHGFSDIAVGQGDLYQLIQEADVVVASYSTSGDEAIALGCPVICYTGLRPSMSSFVDIPAAPLVHDAGELRVALERTFSDPEYLQSYIRQWPALIQGSFYRLDGKASHRILEALLGDSDDARD